MPQIAGIIYSKKTTPGFNKNKMTKTSIKCKLHRLNTFFQVLSLKFSYI